MGNITVPTKETLATEYFVKKFIFVNHPVLLIGLAGCGKTQAAKALVNVPVTKELEVTEKEYQDLLKDPNVISVIKL
jgi:predicted AAA+ superfamily ATPase